jgi:hypothetical protein
MIEAPSNKPKATARMVEVSTLYHSGGYSLQDIGNQYGITRERVRQLVSEAKERGFVPEQDPDYITLAEATRLMGFHERLIRWACERHDIQIRKGHGHKTVFPVKYIPFLMEEIPNRNLPQPDKFWRLVERRGPDECWPWLGAKLGGKQGKQYGRCPWNTEHGEENYTHRYLYTLLHGPIPEGGWILHSCHNQICCNPSHIYLGTPEEGCQLRPLAKGGQGANRKLDPEMVAAIRAEFKPRVRGLAKKLAEKFGVTDQTIRHVYRGNSWKNIPREMGIK